MRIPILAASLLLAAGTAFGQAPATDAAKPPPQRLERFDCKQAKDPKACEEMQTKLRAARDKAAKACEGKTGTERRNCMRVEMCAQSKDPAKCEARAKATAERHQKAMEACKGKEGDALKACMREQRGKGRRAPEKTEKK